MLYLFLLFTIVSATTIQLKENNHISIKGTIDSQSLNKFIIDSSKLSEDVDNIYIYIHSGGGSVIDGMKIIDHMNVLKDTYDVHCISDYSASMAFVILQFCQNRHTMMSSLLMQHQMSLGVKNNLFNMNNYLDMINNMNIYIDKVQAERI
jgi:ATP-dependent protease ClpP protease subunit